jgi:DNA polymerase elongation subunit (family B)
VLEKSLNVLKELKTFSLVGYGISLYDLKLISKKCDKYELEYKNLFSENTVDLHKEIPKYIKLQQYRLEDVTKAILHKELDSSIKEEMLDINATKHCELYLELVNSLSLLGI